MTRSTAATAPRIKPRRIIIDGLIFIGVLALLATQAGSFPASLRAIQHASLWRVLLGLIAVVLTYGVAALSYQSLIRRRLSFRTTLAVQIASGFTNRLLPAGLGGMGLFAAYFHKKGETIAGSAALVATNNLLGIVGNLSLLAVVLLFWPAYTHALHWPSVSVHIYIGGAIIILAALVALLLYKRREHAKASQFIGSLSVALRGSLRPNRPTLLALLCNICLTALNALVLSLSVAAVGDSFSWVVALLALTIGTLVGATVPTPGGIGGVEAGILAVLVAYGVHSPSAVAAVFLYRALTYWLPILPGLFAFRAVRRRFL